MTPGAATKASCQLTPPAFAAAYAVMADELLRERDRLNHRLLEANPVGYSSGFADFLRGLYPL
ncbi:MAG TPA: hypothetical protein VD903_18695 [Pseudonocardia sp.]|nr:hypothetical protein [Pseudonocardia sp.]